MKNALEGIKLEGKYHFTFLTNLNGLWYSQNKPGGGWFNLMGFFDN